MQSKAVLVLILGVAGFALLVLGVVKFLLAGDSMAILLILTGAFLVVVAIGNRIRARHRD
jgi:hypothetical protein